MLEIELSALSSSGAVVQGLCPCNARLRLRVRPERVGESSAVSERRVESGGPSQGQAGRRALPLRVVGVFLRWVSTCILGSI